MARHFPLSLARLHGWLSVLRGESSEVGTAARVAPGWPVGDREEELRTATEHVGRQCLLRWRQQEAAAQRLCERMPLLRGPLQPLLSRLALAQSEAKESAGSWEGLLAEVEESHGRSMRALKGCVLENAKQAQRQRQPLSQELDRMHGSQLSLRNLANHHGYLKALAMREREPEQAAVLMEALEHRVVASLPLEELLRHSAEYAQGFCVEKNGVSPQVRVQMDVASPESLEVVAVRSLLDFVLVELLKNAMQATLSQCGSDIDRIEAAQVVLRCGRHPHSDLLALKVSDEAGGVPLDMLPPHSPSVFDYFHSTVDRPDITYTYSGGFGVPFSGEGVGLPLSRLYARFFGGDLLLTSLPGVGTDAFVYLDATGRLSGDPTIDYHQR